TLEQMMELSELVSLRLPLEQLVEVEMTGFSGSTRGVLLARGEALLATNLSSGKLEFDDASRTVQVTLPAPYVLSATLDQAQTRSLLVTRTGFWHLLPGDAGEGIVVEQAMFKAQQRIQQAASQPHLRLHAKASTQRTLTDWFLQ